MNFENDSFLYNTKLVHQTIRGSLRASEWVCARPRGVCASKRGLRASEGFAANRLCPSGMGTLVTWGSGIRKISLGSGAPYKWKKEVYYLKDRNSQKIKNRENFEKLFNINNASCHLYNFLNINLLSNSGIKKITN